MEIFIIVLIAIGACFFFYYCGRRNSNIKQIKKNEQIEKLNNQLDKQLAEKVKQVDDYNETLFRLSEEYKEKTKAIASDVEANIRAAEQERLKIAQKTQEQINEHHLKAKEEQLKIENDIEFIKNYRFSKINEAATAYRKKQFDEIAVAATQEQENLNQQLKNLVEEKKLVEKEVCDLKLSRDALIEAYKREEELKLQRNFYQVVLTEQDQCDIQILKTIENNLNNKECLYKLIWSVFYMTPTKDMLNRIIGKEKQSGIYKITNQLNGKVYIGQSVDLHTRLTNHIKAGIGISGTIARQLVHEALFEDGIENFTFEIVEKCTKEQLNKKEKLWIETYSSDKYGYNRTAGGAKEG